MVGWGEAGSEEAADCEGSCPEALSQVAEGYRREKERLTSLLLAAGIFHAFLAFELSQLYKKYQR